MNCYICGEDFIRLYIGDKAQLCCRDCRSGKRRCKECRQSFSDPKKDGVFTSTLERKGWYCWDCLINRSIANQSAEEEEHWLTTEPIQQHTDRECPKSISGKHKWSNGTLHGKHWCVHCYIDKEPYVWQVCTVTFEEITNDLRDGLEAGTS